MNIFDDYTHDLLNELNGHKVNYLVVGGYSVNYYGYKRTTGDIDLWIKPHNGPNKNKLLKAFESLGISEPVLKKIKYGFEKRFCKQKRRE